MVGPVILATVVALTALIIVLAVLSAADASVRLLSRTRTRRLVDAEVPGAVALDRLCERPSRLAAALAFWRALGFALGTSAVAYAAFVMVEELTLPVTLAVAAIGMVAMFSIGEALPRAVAVQTRSAWDSRRRRGPPGSPPRSRQWRGSSPLDGWPLPV